jgi:hypothetical protein
MVLLSGAKDLPGQAGLTAQTALARHGADGFTPATTLIHLGAGLQERSGQKLSGPLPNLWTPPNKLRYDSKKHIPSTFKSWQCRENWSRYADLRKIEQRSQVIFQRCRLVSGRLQKTHSATD